MSDSVKELLDQKVEQYNQRSFIDKDPISIPHRFSRQQDIEIMGFWAAVLAWGQRPVILKKANELIERMDGAPYDFVLNHQETDLKRFLDFKHRTFNATDTLYFLHFFHTYYQQHETLEDAFVPTDHRAAPWSPGDSFSIQSSESYHGFESVGTFLETFHDRFCSDPFFPERTRKHIATPGRNSSCKRLNMFLRWMVRSDNQGVDFGIWHRIKPEQLVMPIDVHVGRVARKLGLLTRPQTDWKAATELTETLKAFDPSDPVKYDFALFGLGVEGEM
ncbi:TIGR02757 family protein [Larkinella terrae]|uniref:TIGR02757 family protein n=1 Tax=Larkinella terrae TaxID=2025311 RepID=A0A7K0EJ22_9BACT|nr:TIGR02757 family protein [Larkinella terrae]MRS61860.1 TIGR02757 family protein [Larkinella terrae]